MICYLFVFAPLFPLYRAKKIVCAHTPELVEEAKVIKALTPDGVYWGEYPSIMQQLNPYRIRTSKRYGDGVEIMLTGGLYHSGIVIVTNPVEFNPEEIPFKVEKLNDSVYVFRETGW